MILYCPSTDKHGLLFISYINIPIRTDSGMYSSPGWILQKKMPHSLKDGFWHGGVLVGKLIRNMHNDLA